MDTINEAGVMTREKRIAQAAELFEKFHGADAEHLDTIDLPQHDVGLLVGDCIGIMYETTRNGKKQKYVHEFEKGSRPVLVSSFDGKNLYLLAGAYMFTTDGIEDI